MSGTLAALLKTVLTQFATSRGQYVLKYCLLCTGDPDGWNMPF